MKVFNNIKDLIDYIELQTGLKVYAYLNVNTKLPKESEFILLDEYAQKTTKANNEIWFKTNNFIIDIYTKSAYQRHKHFESLKHLMLEEINPTRDELNDYYVESYEFYAKING